MSHHKRRKQANLIILNQYPVSKKHLQIHFTHGHGSGGQKINKSAIKVQIRLDLADLAKTKIPDDFLAQIRQAYPEGHIETASQRTRKQHKNLAIAIKKLKNKLEECL
jgi:protein subunit release factor B